MSNEIIENAENDFENQTALVKLEINKEKSETTNILKYPKKDLLDILLEDVSQRREEIFLREKVMITVLTAYLATLFVVIGFIFKDNLNVNYVKLIFILIPIFLASGISVNIHQQRIIYTLGAYISIREEEINSILRNEKEIELKDFLKYEKFIHKFNSSRVVLYIDGFLMFITFFPMVAFYAGSLNYVHKLDTGVWFYYDNTYIWYITIFYILIFFIILFIFYYINTRRFYKYVRKSFESYQ